MEFGWGYWDIPRLERCFITRPNIFYCSKPISASEGHQKWCNTQVPGEHICPDCLLHTRLRGAKCSTLEFLQDKLGLAVTLWPPLVICLFNKMNNCWVHSHFLKKPQLEKLVHLWKNVDPWSQYSLNCTADQISVLQDINHIQKLN